MSKIVSEDFLIQSTRKMKKNPKPVLYSLLDPVIHKLHDGKKQFTIHLPKPMMEKLSWKDKDDIQIEAHGENMVMLTNFSRAGISTKNKKRYLIANEIRAKEQGIAQVANKIHRTRRLGNQKEIINKLVEKKKITLQEIEAVIETLKRKNSRRKIIGYLEKLRLSPKIL